MKKIISILILVCLFSSCSKDKTTPPFPITVKYELKFSTGIIEPPVSFGSNSAFRITKIVGENGLSEYVYPKSGVNSWDTTFTITSNQRPLDVGFETTFYILNKKGSSTSSIYINNNKVLSKIDTTVLIGGMNLVGGGTFYYSIKK